MRSNTEDFRCGARAKKKLSVPDIERICGAEILDGSMLDFIDGITTPDRILQNRLMFIDHFDPGLMSAFAASDIPNVLVLAVEGYRNLLQQPRIISALPRAYFAALVRELFDYQLSPQKMLFDPSARIHPTAKVSVGVVVGANSEIGESTFIYPNVTIGPNVSIGRNCLIKSGSVIGQPGFRVYRDGSGLPQHFPHVGGVVIEDEVEIGALNTIASGTIHPTVIESHVKTDDHVHIAHNCYIGARTLITACAELSGSVWVGADCWIGPNATVRDGISIGERAFVGIAANVVAPVPAHTTVYGNPARSKAPDGK
jgi:acyl-[acyl carrier protein]--UDP-N-acetylglucosamine O-acyltransferase